AAKAGHKAIARRPLLFGAKIYAAVAHKFVQFLKRTFIQQQFDAFPGGKLAGFVFAFASFRPAAGLGFGRDAPQLLHAVRVGGGFPCDVIFFSQVALPRAVHSLERKSGPPRGSPATRCPVAKPRPTRFPRQWPRRAAAATEWTSHTKSRAP